ncbi:MAG: glycosyltransferase family 4 protein [Chloroflexi bacterium]|nr:glycosyltransferase family 4 protein [Chloroflexota bacterium]
MRILFLSNFYPPYAIGGYEQWCQEVADLLCARGHTVTVLTSRFGLSPEADQRVEGKPANQPTVIRTLHLQADLAYYQPIKFFLHRPQQERANRAELRRAIDQSQPDVLMVWGMWNLSHNLPYWAEQWLGRRVAYFISSYWPADVDPHTQYWQLPTRRRVATLLKQPLRKAALAQLRREAYPPPLRIENAVCCSRYVRDTLIEAGKLSEKAGVLLGGSDPEPFLQYAGQNDAPNKALKRQEALDKRPLRLVYFGRLIHDKGVHTALEALNLLNQRGLADQFQLTILGSGHPDYEAKLHQMVETFGLRDQVEFIRQVPRAEIPQWLGRFDSFVFTSIWPEPMARSVMEAMAAGLLVIGSEVGGQMEMLVHHQNALTFRAEDAAGLAEQLLEAWQNPAQRQQLAQAGQQMVLERFTLKRMVNDLEAYLLNISHACSVME